jgi:hypothetical protein
MVEFEPEIKWECDNCGDECTEDQPWDDYLNYCGSCAIKEYEGRIEELTK